MNRRLLYLLVAALLLFACGGATGNTVTPAASTASVRAAESKPALPQASVSLPTAPPTAPSATAPPTAPIASWTPAPKAIDTASATSDALVPRPAQNEAGDLRITILYDNIAYDPRLKTEWGFAALVEYGNANLLFDTGGDGQTLLGNLQILGIDPTLVEAVVLSHSHADHTAGLTGLDLDASRPIVYLLSSFPKQLKDQIGSLTTAVEATPGQPIAQGIFTTGQIPNSADVGQAPPIAEQALVIRTATGLVVMTGCAHPGIVNVVRHAKELFGDPVRLVVGGFHLLDASASDIKRIISEFRALGVQQVAPTHCTGEQAIAMFAEEYGDDHIPTGAGHVIVVGSEPEEESTGAMENAGPTDVPPPGEAMSLAAENGPDYWPTDGWRTSTPEEQGMRSDVLAEALVAIQENNYAIDGVVVVRNGYLVLDAYVHPFARQQKHAIRSCTKSVISALVGIALEQGHIESIDQPVLEFFPKRMAENVDPHKEAMTLEHLLLMASGLECLDSYLYAWQGLQEMMDTDDWVQFMLDLPMAEPPGTRFEYCNGASFLLSAILQETTGNNASKFAEEHLFGPLGIVDIEWPSNPQGISIGYGRLQMRPHDMAKFGYLFLNEGVWDGEQVLPTKWVEESTRNHIDATLEDGYGYHWWVNSPDVYLALGYGGQFIFIVPEKHLVAVFVSELPEQQFYVPQDLLFEYIIPAAVSSEPLPEDPESSALLESLVQDLASP
jgi:metal-dependent hydrolase (beta-lactamase superfamily II)/CubicO group peptidase (beta-lactamase class C family)